MYTTYTRLVLNSNSSVTYKMLAFDRDKYYDYRCFEILYWVHFILSILGITP